MTCHRDNCYECLVDRIKQLENYQHTLLEMINKIRKAVEPDPLVDDSLSGSM